MNSIDVNIVPMELKHVEAMAELEQLCFSMPWSRDMLMGELVNEYARYFVAEDEDEKVVGYIGMHLIIDEGYITNVAVSPEYRRVGIGSALIRKVKKTAKREELKVLTLEVRRSNEGAQKLYEKYGFEVVGVRKNYYQLPREDALVMLSEIGEK